MNPAWPTLRHTFHALSGRSARVALVGGLAVGIRCEPRFTRDVDLAVAVSSDAEAEALVRDLLAHRDQASDVLEHEAAGRLATVRLRPPATTTTAAVVDLPILRDPRDNDSTHGAAQRLDPTTRPDSSALGPTRPRVTRRAGRGRGRR